MSHLSETRMNTIQSLLDGYSSLSVPVLLRPLSDDFTHRVLPRSLGMPVRDKEAFSHHAEGIFAIFSFFSKFRMIPEEIYEDEAQGMVIIHAGMEGIVKSRSRRGQGEEWRNECVMIIRLSADGSQVVEIQEFVDSAKALEMKRKHAPRGFGISGMESLYSGGEEREGRSNALRWVGNTMLFTCVAAGTFWGVRRLLHD